MIKSSQSTEDHEKLTYLLNELQPMIHSTAQFIRLAQWKSIQHRKHSFALLLTWILLWTLNAYILYALPMLLVVTMTFYQHTMTSLNQEELANDLIEICNVLHVIESVKKKLTKSDTFCSAYLKHYSIATKRKQSILCFIAACLFTCAYAGWIFIASKRFNCCCSSIAWFVVLLIMCFSSPWVNPIYVACVRAFMPLFYYSIENITNDAAFTSPDSASLSREFPCQESSYLFKIYHHQRWWFPSGWTNLLLPHDKPVWSDVYFEPTPSINEFKLPPTTCVAANNQENQQKIISWTWVDTSWSKQQEQYGTWNWKSWSPQSNALKNCVRRQTWSRLATRKVYLTLTDVTEEDGDEKSDCSSMVGASQTNLSSSINSIWEQEGDSYIPTSGSTFTKPFLLNHFTRRSSSIAMPILIQENGIENDDMYKQFCKSPIPQRIKKFLQEF